VIRIFRFRYLIMNIISNCNCCLQIRTGVNSRVDFSAILTLSNQFIMHSLFYYKIWNNFWCNCSDSEKIVTLQKQIVRIMAGAQPRISYRSLFKQLQILPLPCQYVSLLSSLNVIVNNQENLQRN
jgi:hypothetical protein